MTFDVATAAKQLVAFEGDSNATTADRVCRASERLTVHLARLIGSTGVKTLFHRSLVIASAAYPWLVDADRTLAPGADLFEGLRGRLVPQDPDAVMDAFGVVLETLVGLLGRLIGEDLVWRLLHELWPAVFPQAEKETS